MFLTPLTKNIRLINDSNKMPEIACYITGCDFTTTDLDNAVAAVVLSHHLSTAHPSPAPKKAPAISATKLTGVYKRTNWTHLLENGMCTKAQSQMVRRTCLCICLPAVVRTSNLALKGRTPILHPNKYPVEQWTSTIRFSKCNFFGDKKKNFLRGKKFLGEKMSFF